MNRKTLNVGLAGLSPFAGRTTVHVIVETPRGKRNKYHYDPELNAFRLKKVLAAGFAFPYDFGFIPGTEADDGDPLDVLLLMDEPAYPGCIVEARLIGVLEAEQKEEGETIRNDRLVAVAKESLEHARIESLQDMSRALLDQLEHFFKSYNEAEGKQFTLLAARGPKRAMEVLEESLDESRASASGAES
jgi:inorganic pyrophosphatase